MTAPHPADSIHHATGGREKSTAPAVILLDGHRFMMIRVEQPNHQINVILDWIAELERLGPHSLRNKSLPAK
jgi:hypothetical protein